MQHRAPQGSCRDAHRTFVSLTGPAGNIGDALIRRATLDWARGTSDELVVYTGDAPDVWLRQLNVPPDAILLRSKRSVLRWLWMLLTAPAHPVLVFEAGEVPLDHGNTLRELVFLLETLIVRAKRGVVVRPPRGIRAPRPVPTRIHALAARLSQFALWRDPTSAQLMRGRRVIPDIGFGAGIRDGTPWPERTELIVSMRGGRPHPAPEWVEAIRATASAEGLQIRTIVQVREDEPRSRELATALDAIYEPWADTDPLAHESRLRDRYDRARLVVSDRMHVLVLGALSGAIPFEIAPSPTHKITEAFSAIGFTGVSADSTALTADDMAALLRAQLDREPELQTCVREAARQVDAAEAEVRAAIRTARA